MKNTLYISLNLNPLYNGNGRGVQPSRMCSDINTI